MKNKKLFSVIAMLFLLLLTSCRNESVFSNATNQEKQQDEFFSRLDKSLSNNPDKDKIIERMRTRKAIFFQKSTNTTAKQNLKNKF